MSRACREVGPFLILNELFFYNGVVLSTLELTFWAKCSIVLSI